MDIKSLFITFFVWTFPDFIGRLGRFGKVVVALSLASTPFLGSHAFAGINTAPAFMSLGKVSTFIRNDAVQNSPSLPVNLNPSSLFNNGIEQTYGESIYLQPDGKFLVVGYNSTETLFSANPSKSQAILIRYLADGTVDGSFGVAGLLKLTLGNDISSGGPIIFQPDGKIIIAGQTLANDGESDFVLSRYHANGSLDTSFDGDGKVITDLGGTEFVYETVLQKNGKILLLGHSQNYNIPERYSQIAVVRYNANGSLDTSFSGDGKLLASFNSGSVEGDFATELALQPDGKILIAGARDNGPYTSAMGLMRLSPDGSLDSSFSQDGVIDPYPTASFVFEGAYGIGLQSDGKVVVAGHGDGDFVMFRYNPGGTLDLSFGINGKVATNIGDAAYASNYVSSILLQPDGKILLGGNSTVGYDTNFALARYNSDGSLDTAFSNDGKAVTDFPYPYGTPTNDLGNMDLYGTSKDGITNMALLPNGKILALGHSYAFLPNPGITSKTIWNIALARYLPNGNPDVTFGTPISTLVGKQDYDQILSKKSVYLTEAHGVYDAELDGQGHYQGATLTLMRHGGASPDDVFSASDFTTIVFRGTEIFDIGIGSVAIGSYTNVDGILNIVFNNNATTSRINRLLSVLAYNNIGTNTQSSTITIDWLFSDGNVAGVQGTGGALSVLGTTTVRINESAPTLTAPTTVSYVDTPVYDNFQPVSGKLTATDPEGDSLQFGIQGAVDYSLFDQVGLDQGGYGVLTVMKNTGDFTFAPNKWRIEGLSMPFAYEFAVTVSDGFKTSKKPLVINVAQQGITESIGNDDLLGTSVSDILIGLEGDDILQGLDGDDHINGGGGADTILGGNGNDSILGNLGNDTLTGGQGKDRFIFHKEYIGALPNIDIVTDFNLVDDLVVLKADVFKLPAGRLNANQFKVGSAALDGDDFIVYNNATGELFYDSDGNGTASKIKMAQLTPGLALTQASFIVGK